MTAFRKPNIFIVGAPKTGTSSLFHYLDQHPEVFMSKYKEPCFFASDFESPTYIKTEAQYLALFSDVSDEKWIGEATTTYLYSKNAASEIKDFSPEAKILIMLRNPIDMIYSLHSQRLYELLEDIEDFDKAIDAEEDRKQGKRLPDGFAYPKEYLLYREIAKYSIQVKRYLDIFKKENVHIIIYDDFNKDTEGEFKNVCQFLGISTDLNINYNVVNPRKRLRSKKLERFLKNPPCSLRLILRVFVPRNIRVTISKRLRSFNRLYVPRPCMLSKTRDSLKKDFAADIQEISKMIDRDLTYWVS